MQESGAWGGSFADVFASAQQIISNFVQRIADWIDGQDANDLTEEDIEAEIANLAETVGDTEIASAIEEAVLEELQAQGETQMVWYVSLEHSCANCIANAEASPLPIGSVWPSGDTAPPAHPNCSCSLGVPNT